MDTHFKKPLITTCVAGAIALMSGVASASHFRGAAFIPEIDGNGLLTITETSFWRKGTASQTFTELQPTVNGFATTNIGDSVDTSDSRYDRLTATYTIDISGMGAGTYNISGSSCCRVASGGLGNWTESNETMDAAIVWDGTNATSPINFSFATIQPEVSRLAGNDYSQGLNATSPDGLTLSYDQALNQNITSQVPGFTVNTSTGLMTIVGDANRALITDNSAFNLGADAAFSGNIVASNGSFVEFDWMFDGVDLASNQAPVVDDAVINALVGPGTIMHTFTANDAEDGALTAGGDWDPTLVLGAGFTLALPTFDVNKQQLSWDTTGYAAGTYLIQARAFDSNGVGDFGLLTVNLCQSPNDAPCATTPPPPPPVSVPVPGTLFLYGLGLAGLGWRFKRK